MLRHALLATKTCNLQWPFARPSVSGTLETLIARTRFSKLRKLDGKHWVKLDKIALAANVFSRLSFGQTLTHERGPQTPNATRYNSLSPRRRPPSTSFRQLVTNSTESPRPGTARFVYESSCALRAESSELIVLGGRESFLVLWVGLRIS